MSGSPDLSFLASDQLYEPVAVTVVRAFAGEPAMNVGVQLRLGLQLVLSALAHLKPANRAELAKVFREEVLASEVLEAPLVMPPISHAGVLALQRASAKDLKSVRHMSMH